MFSKKIQLILFLLFCLSFLMESGFIFARELEIWYPSLPILNVDSPSVFIREIKEGNIPKEQAFPLYIKYFYSLFLTISFLFVVGIIIFGGIQWLVSFGSIAKIMAAREMIFNGVLALFFLLSSYIILIIVDPQLAILSFSRVEFEICNCEEENLSLYCQSVCREIVYQQETSIEKYVEIPLGWLIERIRTRSDIVRIQAGFIDFLDSTNAIRPRYIQVSLVGFAQCLVALGNECTCSIVPTEDCQRASGQCQGVCLRDPCDKEISSDFCRQYGIPDLCTNNLREAIEIVQEDMRVKISQINHELERLNLMKNALANEAKNLEMARILMRDSLHWPIELLKFSPTPELTEIRRLDRWENPEPTFASADTSTKLLAKNGQKDKDYEAAKSQKNIFSGFFSDLWLKIKSWRQKLAISTEPTFAQTALGNNLVDYFLATKGNPICRGGAGDPIEYFIAVENYPGDFVMYKSFDQSGYEHFRYDSNYIYYIEDTTWADASGDISCDDNRDPAYYRRYQGGGINCDNYHSAQPAIWVPQNLQEGEIFSETQSIVAFSKYTHQCCQSRYAGTYEHQMQVRRKGAYDLLGMRIENGLILHHLAPTGENFYYDLERGWIGWNRGDLYFYEGNYICDAELLPIPPIEYCNVRKNWIPRPHFPTLPLKRDADPATFYILERTNEEFIIVIERLFGAGGIPFIGPPPDNPDPGFYEPGPGHSPSPGMTEEMINYARFASERTGVRASLILSVLDWESGFRQYPGSGRFPDDVCSEANGGTSYCNWVDSNFNNCGHFVSVWEEVGHLTGYTIETIPVSAAGQYCALGECHNHCGGAMGPAQAMSFVWVDFENSVAAITGNNSPSPWNYRDAFVFAGLHLRDRGGAASKRCLDEVEAVYRYVGGHRNHAEDRVRVANQIADDIGENHCF